MKESDVCSSKCLHCPIALFSRKSCTTVSKQPIKHEAKSDDDTDDGDIDIDDDTGDDNDDVGESPIDLAWPDGVPAAKQPSICNCHRHANYISLSTLILSPM